MDRQRVSSSCIAGTQDRDQPTRRGVLAGVCPSWQGENHAGAIAVASSRALRSGSAGGCARLRRCRSSAGSAKATVAARDRARLPRAHIWFSSRRTRASHRRKNVIGLLAAKFCPTTRSRFLDRPAEKGESVRGHDLRCKARQTSGVEKPPVRLGLLSRSCYARHFGAQAVYVTVRPARHQQDEQSCDPCAANRFLRRNWKRRRAGKILFHARERRKIRWPDFFLGKSNRMDDYQAGRWYGPRPSNANSVFRRLYERFAKRSAKNVRLIAKRLRASRRRREPCLYRPRKQNRVCLRDEPNGAIAAAHRKSVAAGGHHLR